MRRFSFISTLGCSYLSLASSLLGLLLSTLLVVLWMEKEVQALFRELSCPPGQFRDVLTDLGPPWEVLPIPAWDLCAPLIPAGHHGGIQAVDARGLVGRGSWERPCQEFFLCSGATTASWNTLPWSLSPSQYLSSTIPISSPRRKKGGQNPTSLQVSVGPIGCFERCRTVLQEP